MNKDERKWIDHMIEVRMSNLYGPKKKQGSYDKRWLRGYLSALQDFRLVGGTK